MNRKIFIRLIFAVWVFIWLLFLIRPYFKKDLAREYITLMNLSLDEKRAYVTGKDLYEFVKFCDLSVKPSSAYMIVGLEDRPLDQRRAAYYLYPNIESQSPEFIFVYNVRNFSKAGYGIFKSLNSEKYILKR